MSFLESTHWAGATELQDYTPELSTTGASPSYPSSSRFITLHSLLPFLACPCRSTEVNAEWKINQALPRLVFSFLIKLENVNVIFSLTSLVSDKPGASSEKTSFRALCSCSWCQQLSQVLLGTIQIADLFHSRSAATHAHQTQRKN